MKKLLFLVLAINYLIGSNVLGGGITSWERPWTAQEIANYKKAHPGYTIHAETYREGTVPESVVTRFVQPHAPWTEAADAKAREERSDWERALEAGLKSKRELSAKQESAVKKIQKAWKKAKKEKKSKLTPKEQDELDKKLLQAVQYGDLEELIRFLDAGANPNVVDNYSGFTLWCFTPLHYAQTAEQTKVLLAAGANPNVADYQGRTLLFYAKTVEQTKVLLAARANPNAVNDFGRTPLFDTKTVEQTKALLAAGADPNAADYQGSTPLHYAKTAEQTKVLLAAGANPNAADKAGSTPLHYAQTAEQITALLDAGANPNAADYQGFTSMEYAAQSQNSDRLKALIKGGATVPENLKTNPRIKQAAREAMEERIEALKTRDILRSTGLDWGAAEHVMGYEGK